MDDLKNLGVVFTPQIIADYMSKSIIYYYLIESIKDDSIIKDFVFENKTIENKEINHKLLHILKNIKILEPAIGEGALIISIFNLIVKLITKIAPDTNIKLLKKQIIENSLYGFEINESSIEITKKKLLNSTQLNSDIKFNFIHGDFLKYNIKNLIKERFDIIIANPPYIKEKTNKKLFENYKSSEYYQGRMDLWNLFLQYSIDLLKKDTQSILTYIIPNNWLTSKGASKLRESIENKMQIISILDFENYLVFQNAAIQTMILTAKNKYKHAEYSFSYKRCIDCSEINTFLNIDNLYKVTLKNKISNLTFTDISIINLLDKIEKKSNFKLMKLKEVTQGIVHPQNTVSKKNIELVERLTLNEGVFVINEVEKKELGLNKKENSIVKPTYTTKELKRYFKLEKPRFWTIYTDKTFNDEIKIKDYPNIKKHIDKFSKINTSSNKPYGLHRPRNEYFFKKGDKILVARKSIIPTFTYLEDECYPTFTFNVIKSQRISLKYLTILLNSDLITFWLKHRGKMQGTHFQIDIEPLLRIPIVNNTEKTNILEEKLNLLLKEKKLNKKIIEECNLIIYLIYGLSNTEIDIIKKDIRGKS